MKREIEIKIGIVLTNFYKWFTENDLKLNLNKTSFVQFEYVKGEGNIFSFNNSELTIVDYYKV